MVPPNPFYICAVGQVGYMDNGHETLHGPYTGCGQAFILAHRDIHGQRFRLAHCDMEPRHLTRAMVNKLSPNVEQFNNIAHHASMNEQGSS